jgi:hypothetical protein
MVHLKSFDSLTLRDLGKEPTVVNLERRKVGDRSNDLYFASLQRRKVGHPFLDEYTMMRPDVVGVERGENENPHLINLLPQHSSTTRAQR